MKVSQISVLVFLVLSSCYEDQSINSSSSNFCCQDENQVLTGSWLLTEQGYSPGTGYITKEVAQTPPQKIIFRSDSTIETTIESWKSYKFYTINLDTIIDRKFVIFYKKYPEMQPEDSTPTYNFIIKDNHMLLFLNFRWCMEGCHLGFKSID